MSEYDEIHTEAGVAAALAQEANRAAPFAISTGRSEDDDDLLVFRRKVNESEELQFVDLEDYAILPFRKKGSVATIDGASFAEYTNRHKNTAATTLWADFARSMVVAVLDDHIADSSTTSAGWGEHRARLALKMTTEWEHWIARDGRMMTQADFAEHLEDGADCIVTPSAADMLEIAQSFHAKNNVAFRSANRLDSGEVQLQYEETITAKAGQRGQMSIPTSFELGLAPYEGTDAYRLLARFRYRLNDGRLSLGYKLIRPDQIQRAAFDDACKNISEAVELPVIKGTPRP